MCKKIIEVKQSKNEIRFRNLKEQNRSSKPKSIEPLFSKLLFNGNDVSNELLEVISILKHEFPNLMHYILNDEEIISKKGFIRQSILAAKLKLKSDQLKEILKDFNDRARQLAGI